MKDYLSAQIDDDAQVIVEKGHYMYVCSLDKNVLSRENNYNDAQLKVANAWRIKRIETTTTDTEETTVITYPFGDKRHRFSVATMEAYSYSL